MYKISKILSAIFSPLLMPTYSMVLAINLSILSLLPTAVQWTSIGVVFLFTCIVPVAAIYALYKAGVVSDLGLNIRTERPIPYLIVTLSYGASAWFLFRANAPEWLPMFFLGAGVATVINTIVNRWWKISAHAAGLGGCVAMLFKMAQLHQAVVSLDWWISGAIIATGMVMTARVYMKRHTLMQVLAGCANGFLCVWLI